MAVGEGGKNQYLTHWHGGASFVVKILKSKLVVYTSKFNKKRGYYEPDKKVYETPYKQVYIPTGFGPNGVGIPVVGDERGNSILARIDDSGKHVYVGHDVLEFEVYEFIEGFYSEVNLSDEPQAYIVTKDLVYVINDDRFYLRSIFPSLLDVIERPNAKRRSKTLKAKMKKGFPMESKIIVPA
jgi:hypothetical protein